MTPYILNVALIITGCLIFYKLLLQKETFYKINRYILIVCLLIAFTLPLIKVPQQLSFRKTEQVHTSPSLVDQSFTAGPDKTVSQKSVESSGQVQADSASSWFSKEKLITWALYLYWFGVIAFGINFLVQVLVLLFRAYKSPVIIDGKYRIVEVSGDKAPCSFGNNIFINPEKYEWETYSQILLHEKVHVNQKHSLDLLFAELVLIFQWFNPFAWLYRKEIENNLEFLTDEQMVEANKVEKESYQYSLLKVSAPQRPLAITTNYNQSLLKKRIAMMNTKKSNVHTAWKYFFLLPVLVLFASLLNEPAVQAQNNNKHKENAAQKNHSNNAGMETEGSWFATIKDDVVNIQFKTDADENSFNNSTFKLSEFSTDPRGNSGSFKVTREAGTINFTGKFDGDQGMGKYKFTSDNDYASVVGKEIKEALSERDLMVFFFIDVTKSYVKMLKEEGFTDLDKDEVIPMAALKIDGAYIRSLKEAGMKDLDIHEIIPFKSLGIDEAYIRDIRNAGYQNISAQQLITFKAQKIDGNYIKKVRSAAAKESGKTDTDVKVDDEDIVAYKALDIDDEYINSFKSVGLTDVSRHDWIPMKSLGITPDFVKGFQAIGYKDITPSDLIPLKAQKVTPEYIKSFEELGFKNVPLHDFIAVKAMNISAEYIKEMKDKGFNYNKLDKYITLKSLN